MSINKICPKCGATNVQLSNERGGHGCLFTILFGIWYLIWVLIKWTIGLLIFVCYDWWMAIIHKIMKKGHVWQCRKWFSNKKRIYYCHNCGHNFKA